VVLVKVAAFGHEAGAVENILISKSKSPHPERQYRNEKDKQFASD
jgi:hypothetical protein